jgi:hypothetical protein
MLILEGVRRKDEWVRCRESIRDPRWVPKLVRAVDVKELGQTELTILREINAQNSIETIALECRLALFHVLLFVYQGLAHGLFDLLPPPNNDQTPIPGFTEVSWGTLIKQAEDEIEAGNLMKGFRRLSELREKYANRREVSELLMALEERIGDKLENLELSTSVIPELAVPPTELKKLSVSPREGFLLSRINGAYTLEEILKMIPGSALEGRLMVDALIRREVVRLKLVDDSVEARS